MNWIERCKLAIAMLSNGLKAVFRSDDLITVLNHGKWLSMNLCFINVLHGFGADCYCHSWIR